jgi:hypothetical protein
MNKSLFAVALAATVTGLVAFAGTQEPVAQTRVSVATISPSQAAPAPATAPVQLVGVNDTTERADSWKQWPALTDF